MSERCEVWLANRMGPCDKPSASTVYTDRRVCRFHRDRFRAGYQLLFDVRVRSIFHEQARLARRLSRDLPGGAR